MEEGLFCTWKLWTVWKRMLRYSRHCFCMWPQKTHWRCRTYSLFQMRMRNKCCNAEIWSKVQSEKERIALFHVCPRRQDYQSACNWSQNNSKKSCGSSSHSMREALLREVHISLMTKARLKLMCEENKPAKAIKYVDAIRKRDKAQKKKQMPDVRRKSRTEAQKVWKWARPRRCPAFGKQGKNCEKNRTLCLDVRCKCVCDQAEELFTGVVHSNNAEMNGRKQTSGLQMWKRRRKTKNFKLDTGAQAMVLSFNLLEKLRKTETLREARVMQQPPQARELQSEENALCRWNPERKCMSSLSLWWKEKWRQFWVWRYVNRGAR